MEEKHNVETSLLDSSSSIQVHHCFQNETLSMYVDCVGILAYRNRNTERDKRISEQRILIKDYSQLTSINTLKSL